MLFAIVVVFSNRGEFVRCGHRSARAADDRGAVLAGDDPLRAAELGDRGVLKLEA